MYIPSREKLLQLYESDVRSAYADRLDGYKRYLETREGSLRAMASHCGAELGAAHKRCKRDLVFSCLLAERLNTGLDITPTLAENLCAKLIGRGVDLRIALEMFGTPGRTAANKSKVTQETLDELEAALEPMVQSLVLAMQEIRIRYRDDYDDRVAKRRFEP
ncbi:hypothetical protein [Pseudomonas sp. KCJK8751]|uniref:hypothetical protein n=1 Tax=Pseudomonas sp. KCJK8751 TaxID=3344564 RepID=UPI003905EF57